MPTNQTRRRRQSNPSFEFVIRSIIGPEQSKRVEELAHLHGVSFERKWRAIVNQGLAVRS